MKMKHNITYDYFMHNNTCYGVGTEVEIFDDIFEDYKKRSGKKFINNKMFFVCRFSRDANNESLTFKTESGTRWTIPTNKQYIKRVIKGIPYQPRSKSQIAYDNYKNKKGKPDIFNGCCWFVVLIFLSLFVKGTLFAILGVVIWFTDYLIEKYNFK